MKTFFPKSVRQLAGWFGLLLALAACSGAPGQAQPTLPVEAIVLEDCQLSAPDVAIRMMAQCGRLAVPENPQAPNGRQIELHLAVIPAISRSPAPDPLVFLAGGPGQAASEAYLTLASALDRINQKRDIILLDQRGTGGSNPLECQAVDQTQAQDPAELGPFLQTCLDHLDADPRFYTTSIAMQDLDQVREALGYQQINLYGVSYGTRAALTYIRMYPQRVRTAILDGVVPQDEPLGPEVAPDAQRALDNILARCQADAACQQAFPDLAGHFSALLDDLAGQPVKVNLIDPLSGEQIEQTFDRAQFAVAVRLLSYAQETVALMPLLLDTAYSRNDFAPMAAQYQIVAGSLSDSISNAMGYSVVCSEDFPFIDLEAAQKLAQGTYYGDQEIRNLQEICSVWPAGEIPADFHDPVRADMPVLLLSGENDPVTPPANAEHAAQTLSNSLSLVAAGQGHNVIFRGCLPNLAYDFIEAGSLEGLDSSCVQTIAASPFFVNFNGPQP